MDSKLQTLVHKYVEDFGDLYICSVSFEDVLKAFAEDVLRVVKESIDEVCVQCKTGTMQPVARRGDRQFYTCSSCGTSWSRKEGGTTCSDVASAEPVACQEKSPPP